MEQEGNKHYIRIDEHSRILRGFSDAFHEPEPDDIMIAENAGRHFKLIGKTNPPLKDDHGIPLYKWDGSAVVERTEQEIQDDIDALPEPPPSDKERLEALEAAMLEVIMGG